MPTPRTSGRPGEATTSVVVGSSGSFVTLFAGSVTRLPPTRSSVPSSSPRLLRLAVGSNGADADPKRATAPLSSWNERTAAASSGMSLLTGVATAVRYASVASVTCLFRKRLSWRSLRRLIAASTSSWEWGARAPSVRGAGCGDWSRAGRGSGRHRGRARYARAPRPEPTARRRRSWAADTPITAGRAFLSLVGIEALPAVETARVRQGGDVEPPLGATHSASPPENGVRDTGKTAGYPLFCDGFGQI